MKNRNRSNPSNRKAHRSKSGPSLSSFRCIFELALPGPVPNDPETQNAFLYALGTHAEPHHVAFHTLSLRDGLDLYFSVRKPSDAKEFVRAVAADLEGYLAARFEWPLGQVRARAMLQPLVDVTLMMDAMSSIAVRDQLGTTMMPSDMLSDAKGFAEVVPLSRAA